MFGLSFWEIAIVLAIALIVLGPKKLPELARSLGKGIREFRRATDDFKSSVESGMNDEPPKQIDEPEAEIVEDAADAQKAAEAEAAAVVEVEEAKKAAEAKSEG